MSENNTNSISIKFELPQVANEALTPLTTAIGNTLATVWNGWTINLQTWYGKKKIDHDLNLEAYRKAVQDKLSEIKEENLQEPKMNILGPSLEASKYYFEEEQYREMFSNLIAGSCDKSKNGMIHPYFVEAIKQMTPQEAKILASFKLENTKPICNYWITKKKSMGSGKREFFANVFYTSSKQTEAPDTNSSSIVNLCRMGLLKTDFTHSFKSKDPYDIFERDTFVIQMREDFKPFKDNPNVFDEDVSIEKGIVSLTPLGKNFINICI